MGSSAHNFVVDDVVWERAAARARAERRPLVEVVRFALEVYGLMPEWRDVLSVPGGAVAAAGGVPGGCAHPGSLVVRGLCHGCGRLVVSRRGRRAAV